MKKQILISLCALFSISSYAQLKVSSTGQTNIQRTLKVNPDYNDVLGALMYGSVRFRTDTSSNLWANRHIDIATRSNSTLAYGIHLSSNIDNTTATSYGIHSLINGGNNGAGIWGGLYPSSSLINGAGIYGSSSSSTQMPSGIYAGYFYGDVKATGTIYGTLVSPSSVSSPSNGGGETTVVEVDSRQANSVTSKLRGVDLLQMERVNQNGSLAANKIEVRESVETGDFDTNGLTTEEIEELEETQKQANAEPIQTTLSAVSYGLAADQLQKVYPELVYEDAEGNYSINYIEMVPLLVQSIKELSAEVTSLKQQLGIAEKAEVKAESEETDDIALVVPEGAKDATLSFFDLSGKQVRSARVIAESSNAKTYTRGLPSGAYVCTLVVDGQVKSSRKIVVNK